MDLRGARVFAGNKGANERRDLLADQVRSHRDDAVAAQGHHGQDVAVVAAPHAEPTWRIANDLADLLEVGAGFLDANDFRHLGEIIRDAPPVLRLWTPNDAHILTIIHPKTPL